MRDRLTSLIAIALLVTLCAMSYWYSVKAELENVTHLSDLNSPDFIARDITITQFDDDGIAKAKVFAKEVEHYSDGHANAKFPEYASLNPNEAQITAKSDRATMVDGGAVIHFYNNVDIRQAATKDAPASRLLTSQLDAYRTRTLINPISPSRSLAEKTLLTVLEWITTMSTEPSNFVPEFRPSFSPKL